MIYRVHMTDEQILQAINEGIYIVNQDTAEIRAGGATGRVLIPWMKDDRAFVRLHYKGCRVGTSVAKVVWMSVTRSLIPPRFEIHHASLGKKVDAWENLICVHTLDHQKLHRQLKCTQTEEVEEEIPF